jgi:hypothetical protein
VTEHELLDVFLSFQSLQQAWLASYVSALTAYLLAAYFIGAKLTRSQAVIVTVCFVVYSLECVYAAAGNGARMLELVDEVHALNPHRQFAVRAWVLWLGAAILTVGVFVSLKFMWDVRHPKAA